MKNTSILLKTLSPFRANKPAKKAATWQDLYFQTPSHPFFSKTILAYHINKFWDKIMLPLNADKHAIVIVRVQFVDGGFVSLGKLAKVGYGDKQWLIAYTMHYMDVMEAYYITENPIKAFVFSHGIRDGAASAMLAQAGVSDPQTALKALEVKVNSQTFKHIKLPVTMDPLKYGTVMIKAGNSYTVSITPKTLAHITVYEKHNDVQIFKSGILVLEYKDFIDLDPNSGSMTRVIGARAYYYVDGELVLSTIDRKSSNFILRTKQD